MSEVQTQKWFPEPEPIDAKTKIILDKITERCFYHIKNNYKWRNIRNVPKPFDFPKYVWYICNDVDNNKITIKIFTKKSDYKIIVEIKDKKPNIYARNKKRPHKLKTILTYIKSCVDEAYELFYDNYNDANDYYYDDDFPEENIPNYI